MKLKSMTVSERENSCYENVNTSILEREKFMCLRKCVNK